MITTVLARQPKRNSSRRRATWALCNIDGATAVERNLANPKSWSNDARIGDAVKYLDHVAVVEGLRPPWRLCEATKMSQCHYRTSPMLVPGGTVSQYPGLMAANHISSAAPRSRQCQNSITQIPFVPVNPHHVISAASICKRLRYKFAEYPEAHGLPRGRRASLLLQVPLGPRLKRSNTANDGRRIVEGPNKFIAG